VRFLTTPPTLRNPQTPNTKTAPSPPENSAS
jgi:hypothetical protein